MNIQAIRTIARQHGVKISRMRKADLIRAVQRAEGNFDCFGAPSDGYCDQPQCIWREDCLGSAAAHKA